MYCVLTGLVYLCLTWNSCRKLASSKYRFKVEHCLYHSPGFLVRILALGAYPNSMKLNNLCEIRSEKILFWIKNIEN